MLKQKILSVQGAINRVLENPNCPDAPEILRACARNLSSTAELAGEMESLLVPEASDAVGIRKTRGLVSGYREPAMGRA